MTDPLAILRFPHGEMRFWLGCIESRMPDDRSVPAAPNGDETWVHTACHEAAHHLAAWLLHDRPSVCLGAPPVWTPERLEEEQVALKLGPVLMALHEALGVYDHADPGQH